MSKMKKWGLILLVCLISASLLAGCGGAKKDGAKPVAKKQYTLGTGGSGGVFYVLGAGKIIEHGTMDKLLSSPQTDWMKQFSALSHRESWGEWKWEKL